MTSGSTAGLTLTDQAPLATATVTLNTPITTLWKTLFKHELFQRTFVQSIRAFACKKTVPDLYDDLDGQNIPVWLWSWIRDTARGDERAIKKLAFVLVPRLGTGHSTVTDILRTAELFEWGDSPETIAINVTDTFFEDRTRQQREHLLELISVLARGFDIRLVATRRVAAKLRDQHRRDLAAVSDWQSSPHNSRTVTKAVEQALIELDPAGRAVKLLRDLRESPSQSLSYSSLYAQTTVSNDRVRQVLLQLADLGLVERFGPTTDRHVELLHAGDAYLEALAAEARRQQTLENAVSQTRKSSPQAVYPTQARGGEKDGSLPYRTRFSDRATHAAAAGCSTPRTITTVPTPQVADESTAERRTKYVSYRSAQKEAVVSVQASGGLQYVVSLATALAHAGFLSQALSAEQLAAIDEPPRILREARNIGAVSDDALNDPDVLCETLAEWGDEIESLTTQLNHGEYEDRDRFRGTIMRTAHGLAGSIIHLLDALGINIVRDIRVPGNLDERHRKALSQTIAVSAAIQSRYGSHAAYRQLFTTDAGQPSLTPTIDAAAPSGQLIGSFVLRGPDIQRLRDPLATRLSRPGELHENCPEFIISVPIREAGRDAYRATVGRALSSKNLRTTEQAVRLLYGLSPSPYATAQGICRGLEREAVTREVRVDEIRRSLAPLDADVLVPNLPPTVGRMLSVLLRSSGRLTQVEVAEAAGVSPRSVSTYRDHLEGLGLIDVGAAGWRLSLSFSAPEAGERYNEIVPEPVDGTFVEAVDGLCYAVLPPPRYSDPTDSVGSVVYWPPDPWRLVEVGHSLGAWVALGARLTDEAAPSESGNEDVIAMGPSIEQTALSDPYDSIPGMQKQQ